MSLSMVNFGFEQYHRHVSGNPGPGTVLHCNTTLRDAGPDMSPCLPLASLPSTFKANHHTFLHLTNPSTRKFHHQLSIQASCIPINIQQHIGRCALEFNISCLK